MDYRHPLSRKTSSNTQSADMGKMSSTFPTSGYNPAPLQPNHQQPLPVNPQSQYMPSAYPPVPPDYPRSNSAGSSVHMVTSGQMSNGAPAVASGTPPPGQMASRYHPVQQYPSPMNHPNYSPTPVLPQPGQGHPMPSHQPYAPTSSSQPYQPRIAPAPPRQNFAPPTAPPYLQARQTAPFYVDVNGVPPMRPEPPRDQFRQHVVGAQGRRGILPSAPGRASGTPTGSPGSSKSATLPAKDADGKFPCPNCNKTYLHAKHLKRHLLRHTGDRPYMCVLCNDTFSRSDILKRHFQKCSLRKGNPTGASHLSSPAAHLKKSATAANNAAAKANQQNQAQKAAANRVVGPGAGPNQAIMSNGNMPNGNMTNGNMSNGNMSNGNLSHPLPPPDNHGTNGVNGNLPTTSAYPNPQNVMAAAPNNGLNPYSGTFWDPEQVVPQQVI